MTKATVLGSGIVGLWTAYVLSERGFQVDVIARGGYNQTTSAAAVSVLTPFLPDDPNSLSFHRGIRWARETLAKFTEVNEFSDALEPMPCYEFGAQGYLEADFPVTKLHHLDFSTFDILELREPVADCDFAVHFQCKLANTQVFLPWLQGHLSDGGVKFSVRTLESAAELAEMDADVVFNCLGFNSVFSDPAAFPVHGQSMFVEADTAGQEKFGLGAGHHAVFTHRRGYYIGSFFMPGPRYTPGRELYESSLDFVANAFPALCRSVGRSAPKIDLDKIVRVNSGIRPFRNGGPRVELDRSHGVPLVHNYGHGAHGWTVGYGASVEAVDIFVNSGMVS